MTPNMVDLYWQDNMSDKNHAVDFAGLFAQGIFCVAHKASQGSHFKDPLYASRRKQCLAQAPQMLWMAYHFLDASDVAAQADNFHTAAGIADTTLPPPALAADYEPNGGNTPALHQLMSFCIITDDFVPALTFIYSGNLIRETLLPHVGGHQDAVMKGAEDFFRKHPLWLPEYGPHENIPWPWNKPAPNETKAPGCPIWQYNDRGRFKQLLGAVDVNFVGGTREQLATLWPQQAA